MSVVHLSGSEVTLSKKCTADVKVKMTDNYSSKNLVHDTVKGYTMMNVIHPHVTLYKWMIITYLKSCSVMIAGSLIKIYP